MSPEEYRSGLVAVEATVRAILERIQQIRASDDAVRLIRVGAVTLEDAANGFVLADTAAWTAFRTSLSESCKPKP